MSTNSEASDHATRATENNVNVAASGSAVEESGTADDQVECALEQRATGEDSGKGSSGESASQTKQLSKNQMKKLKKKEHWLQVKADKRKAEREKKKRRHAEQRERGEVMGPTRKALKKNRMVDSPCQQRVVIDCSFDSYMTEKDSMYLVDQIRHCYAANRRADSPLQLYICGVSGKAKERLDSLGDYKGWDLHKDERHYAEAFPKDEIVYLSSDSPNILDTLDHSKVYVIGGLVDHNHHKGLCHRLAEERGMNHAQLPIGHFLQLKSRKVLTINHVFEILLHFTKTQDWQKSFLSVLPQRKGLCLKPADNDKPEAVSMRSAEQNDTKNNGVKTSGVVKEQEHVAEDCEKLSASSSDSGTCLVEALPSEDAVSSAAVEECKGVCPSQSEASEDKTTNQKDEEKEDSAL